ncbi:Uncharacterized protein Rs2_51367 [Raphanus sativus]|uniref:Uncharacterized protein LOC108860074 isoform X1 n=1 Tax=Raphanus sativus TaxID=3726 RepID=A0A6J0P0M7_RAPSA|nr:uncharacterized protein LOC108860074 isoform X1 [Raphanus sativus]KAJ4867093.1 Uncharacterized protein Rs2_51367 [Raphanus sativus]
MSSVDNIFAPERISIQCYLWRCEIPVHDYCSDSHRELAVNGEGIGNAITFIDGKKDPEIFEMSRKILLSKRRRKHCGVPHVAASDICSNPWEQGRVFWRELEPDETKRSWLFISEKDPEGFGIMWLPVHRPIDLPGGCVCQKYWLQPDYIQASGSFRLLRITDCFERFNKAVYWLNFMYHNKVADKGKAVTVGVSSEGKPAKRQHMDPTHIGLPKVLQMDPNYHPPRGSTSLKLNQVQTVPMMGYGKLVHTLDGSYVLVKGKVAQTLPVEVIISHLLGIFEKARAKKLEEYLAQASPEFLIEMLELCDNRMVLFDKDKRKKAEQELLDQNKEMLELCDNRMLLFEKDKRKKAVQVQKLLSLVDSISRNCNGKPFADELFHELQELLDQNKEVEALKGYDTMQQVYFRKQVGNKEGEVNDNESGKEKQVSVAD